MKTLSIQLPDEIYDEFINISSELKITPDNCALLAISHLMQTDSFQNAMEGMRRYQDGQQLHDFPEFQEELGVMLNLHPEAMQELETLEEEQQIDILAELVDRTTLDEEELEDTIDLVLKDEGETQMVLSTFEFGDIIYEIGENITIYHLALNQEDEDDEDGDDEDDEDDEEFDEEDEFDDEFDDEFSEEDSLENSAEDNPEKSEYRF